MESKEDPKPMAQAANDPHRPDPIGQQTAIDVALGQPEFEPTQDRNLAPQLESADEVFGLFAAMVLEPEIVGKLTLEAEPIMLGLNPLRFRVVIHIANSAQSRMPGGRDIGVTLRATQRVRDRYLQ